ncbi:MAG TPA: phosphoribosyltransferase family protein [Thermoplasmata archaeon]|nr:phosphoribosyltransferase family protein [Thermoplasmata archaeon]
MVDPPGPPVPLADRKTAGEQLAERLLHYRDQSPVVLALPRGGVPVAFEIAQRLNAPLDVLIVRKVGAPSNPEYGLGAVVEGGTRFLDEPRIHAAGYTVRDLGPTIAREAAEVERRAQEYRAGKPAAELRDRTVILVDDGVATGGTVLAALRAVRLREPRRIVLALGVAPPDTVDTLRPEVDDLVVLLVPSVFFAVGEWYHRFSQVSDGEVRRLLERSRTPSTLPGS